MKTQVTLYNDGKQLVLTRHETVTISVQVVVDLDGCDKQVAATIDVDARELQQAVDSLWGQR